MTQLCFHVRCHFVKLQFSCYLKQGKKIIGYWQECSTSIAIPPTSASAVVSQYDKIQVITFKEDFCSFLANMYSQW